MELLIGYGIVGLYLVLLLLIGRRVGRRFPENNSIMHEYLFAGKRVPFGLLAPSIFTSWLWVTSIVGSGKRVSFRIFFRGYPIPGRGPCFCCLCSDHNPKSKE
jgi:Na+/proline symporter